MNGNVKKHMDKFISTIVIGIIEKKSVSDFFLKYEFLRIRYFKCVTPKILSSVRKMCVHSTT